MMTWKDYGREVEADAMKAIDEGAEYYETWDEMYDELFIDDAVTGNGSGSYTFSTQEAAENAAGIVWDEDAIEGFRGMGYDGIPTEQGPEAVDVIARCIWLGNLSGTLEEYFEDQK